MADPVKVLSPPPIRAAVLTDKGLVSREWSAWFQEVAAHITALEKV